MGFLFIQTNTFSVNVQHREFLAYIPNTSNINPFFSVRKYVKEKKRWQCCGRTVLLWWSQSWCRVQMIAIGFCWRSGQLKLLMGTWHEYYSTTTLRGTPMGQGNLVLKNGKWLNVFKLGPKNCCCNNGVVKKQGPTILLSISNHYFSFHCWWSL